VCIVVALAVTVPALLAMRRRRRKREAPATRATEPPAALTAAESRPGAEATAPEAGEEPLYACPACGTSVRVDATSCQGCGALFED